MSYLEAEVTRLREENQALKALLATHGIPLSGKTVQGPTPQRAPRSGTLSPDEKVALFRRLFRGRDDVFPIRWESQQSGKAGYSPTCANEWRRGICEKPRIKCSECQHSLYVPVSDHVITRHLKGEITAGVYPLLPGDRCHFLAIDLDDEDWREDARVLFQTCQQNSLPAALEISRSGNGAHLWLFFAMPVIARDARQLGTALISATCARTRQLKLASYDRLFPNQDTMPKGGFGNCVPCPCKNIHASLAAASLLMQICSQYMTNGDFWKRSSHSPQNKSKRH